MTAKFKTTLALLCLGLSLIPFSTWSQADFQVEKADIPRFVRNLEATFGPTILIPYQEVTNHLTRILRNAEPQSNCGIPNATVLEYSDDEVIFQWDAVEGAQFYIINWLNTETGEEGFYAIQPNPDGIYTLPFPYNGLIMFGIQSVCHNPLPGGAFVIIQDKVVLKIKFNDGIGCGCEAYESTEVLLDQWPYIAPDAEFDIRIVANGFDNDLATIHGKRIGDDVHFNLSCPTKLQIVEQNHVLFFYNYNDQYQGLMNFEPNWYFIPEWTVLFSTCKAVKVTPPVKRLAFEKNEAPVSRVFPNPVKDQLWLENGNFKKGELVMKIFNPAGKLVQTINSYVDENEANTQAMEVGALHEGLYFLKVIQEEQISSFTFYKE
jgi:hypothetical protein